MHVAKDALLVEQVRVHRLVFTCEGCAHFCSVRELCAVLYPTTPHRAATVAALEDGDHLDFCKMFEADDA